MGRYEVQLTRRAARDLAAVPESDRKRIARKIDRLEDDPRPTGCRKLAGSEDLYRIRSGDYRIVYQLQGEVLVVLVVLIRRRDRAYDDLQRLLGSS
jgi:mRNA interferase RelE/StbE